MKKFMTYARNRKGVTLVLMAIMLAVLIMLASLAIDISYMYYAKNQLQVAADAAALAGASQLDEINVTSVVQEPARQQAWKFACKNTAAGDPVFLVTNTGGGGSGNICDSPPAASNLNSSNLSDGDIVLGNWNFSTRQFSTDNISNSKPINAVKVTARRTGETPGMEKVGLFLGKIFQLIGADWSVMSVKASAIAAMPPRASSFVSVGRHFCPSVGDPACIGGTGSTYPINCNLVSPREIDTKTSSPYNNQMGWTSLLEQPGSTNAFEQLMCGVSPYEAICPPVLGIYGISGTSSATFKDYKSLMCDPGFDSGSKEIDPFTGRVTGWEVIIPIVNEDEPMDPNVNPNPHPVLGYAKVHIIEVCAPGAAGCRGAGSCNFSSLCPEGSNSILLDRISCIPCGTDAIGLKPALVQ